MCVFLFIVLIKLIWLRLVRGLLGGVLGISAILPIRAGTYIGICFVFRIISHAVRVLLGGPHLQTGGCREISLSYAHIPMRVWARMDSIAHVGNTDHTHTGMHWDTFHISNYILGGDR